MQGGRGALAVGRGSRGGGEERDRVRVRVEAWVRRARLGNSIRREGAFIGNREERNKIRVTVRLRTKEVKVRRRIIVTARVQTKINIRNMMGAKNKVKVSKRVRVTVSRNVRAIIRNEVKTENKIGISNRCNVADCVRTKIMVGVRDKVKANRIKFSNRV